MPECNVRLLHHIIKPRNTFRSAAYNSYLNGRKITANSEHKHQTKYTPTTKPNDVNNQQDATTFSFVNLFSFGGLEVACWPLVPKFAGSNPAEAVGFF